MKNSGQILIQSLVLSALAVVLLAVLVNVALFNLTEMSRAFYSEQSFQIAEAGVEYYRWHLAHAPEDFTNGTGQPGPYEIDYYDKDGVKIGKLVLNITPPIVGSTAVTIRSTGIVDQEPVAARTIEVVYGIPSIAKYATVANDRMRFGAGTEVYGEIHSNGGIRFDGTAFNLVTSAETQYDDADHTGGDEHAVHTHRDYPPATTINENFRPLEAPPNPVDPRLDVFRAGREFPVPAVDFTGLTADLAQIRIDAQADGLYFPDSGVLGYEIVLRTNDTMDVYAVQSLLPPPSSSCTNAVGEAGWGTWSIQATTTVGNYPFPNNGLAFFEDHVWVSGMIDDARITIASGKFPENPLTDTSITVNNDLTYTEYNETNVIGLIAQNNINIGLYSENDLEIDAALIAKNGRVGRYYYRAPWWIYTRCGNTALRQIVTLHGSIATNRRYGFSWSCGGSYCSGYAQRIIRYDAKLLYSPPPNFPLTADEYELVSWQEISR